MQTQHSAHLHFPIDKKDKLSSFITPCRKWSSKEYYYRLCKRIKTDYHSVHNHFTASKMRSTLLTIAFSIIGEYRIQSVSYYARETLQGDSSVDVISYETQIFQINKKMLRQS